MKIAMAASEAAPFIKTGGLADVVGTLPKYLAQAGEDVFDIASRYHASPAAILQAAGLEEPVLPQAARLLIPVMVERAEIPPETRANSVTRTQRRRLLELTKGFSVAIRGPRPVAEAIVTAGGVAVREVQPKTMESKLVEGLYFAGEILDVDAYTGGFNLQIAWSTGRAAGIAAAEKT